MNPALSSAPATALLHNPLFIKGLLVVGGVALAIGGFRYLYGKIFN